MEGGHSYLPPAPLVEVSDEGVEDVLLQGHHGGLTANGSDQNARARPLSTHHQLCGLGPMAMDMEVIRARGLGQPSVSVDYSQP